jgi:branched-chain amino acid transport system substrate-binding protein
MRPRLAMAPTLALLAIAAVLAACGSDGEGDPSLTVYLSAPLRGPSAADGHDVADGARMALDDAGGEAADTPVRLVVLGDAAAGGATAAMAGANARTATEDSTAIAYVGELDSGTTRTALPITNEAGLLQVSAGASATDLTRAAPGSDQIPDDVQPSGARTFARVIPSDVAQGAAAAGAAADAGSRDVRLFGDGSRYEQSLRFGFDSVTDAPPLVSGGSADGVYDAGAVAGAAGLPAGLEPRVPRSIIGADAQISGSPPQADMRLGSLLVSGALAPSQLADPDFADLFSDAYDRPPGRFAAYGYEAMASVLDAIDRAGDPLDRKSVVDAYFATTDRDSVLGSYSIDDAGDTSLGVVGAYRQREGATLRPLREPLAVP